MNDQQIYELLAKNPSMRAVQICDALDQELCDVSEMLKSLVDVGDVVRTPGTAPNGQAAQFYALSDAFKAGRDYKDIQAKLQGERVADACAAPTPAPTPENTSAPVPPARPKSRTDDAIEYIKQRGGKISNAELKTHMRLQKGESPASWLAIPIRDGRLKRDGVFWLIGSGKPASTVGVATAPIVARGAIPKLGDVLSLKLPTPPPDAFKVPAEMNDSDNGPSTPVTAFGFVADMPATAAGIFRCGLWSDGVLELQRDGQTLAQLTRGEGEHMADFIGRMLAVAA
jgi:hypothetical protein